MAIEIKSLQNNGYCVFLQRAKTINSCILINRWCSGGAQDSTGLVEGYLLNEPHAKKVTMDRQFGCQSTSTCTPKLVRADSPMFMNPWCCRLRMNTLQFHKDQTCIAFRLGPLHVYHGAGRGQNRLSADVPRRKQQRIITNNYKVRSLEPPQQGRTMIIFANESTESAHTALGVVLRQVLSHRQGGWDGGLARQKSA